MKGAIIAWDEADVLEAIDAALAGGERDERERNVSAYAYETEIVERIERLVRDEILHYLRVETGDEAMFRTGTFESAGLEWRSVQTDYYVPGRRALFLRVTIKTLT